MFSYIDVNKYNLNIKDKENIWFKNKNYHYLYINILISNRYIQRFFFLLIENCLFVLSLFQINN